MNTAVIFEPGGGGGGERGNLGNARKKTFFFKGGVPLGSLLITALSSWRQCYCCGKD